MAVSSQDVALFTVRGGVSPAALDAAGPAVLDTLAAMIAGSIEPAVSRLASALPPVPGTTGFPMIGTGASYRADDAALLYGTAAHTLDYDDVSMLAISHPSAPVLSALLAAAGWADTDGKALRDAHAIGTEVMIRMGQAIGLRHYEIGFHATATLGLFGAVAAICRLRGMDAEKTHTSFAIAASMAGGLRLNFGSDVKAMHVGLAACGAVRAADWSMAGITASHADLFGPSGMLATLSGRDRHGWPDGVVLGQPFAIVEPGFETKRFPGCYLLHKVMALGIAIAQEQIGLAQMRTIEVIMPRGGTRPLIHPFPANGREAQFSIPYAMLSAISDGEITFATFTEEAVARPGLRARLCDVVVTEAGDEPGSSEALGAAPVRIVLRMNDGSERVFERTASPGSAQDPMTTAQRRAKWIDCLRRANPSLSPDDAGDAYERADRGLESERLSAWLPALWQLAAPHSHAGRMLCHD